MEIRKDLSYLTALVVLSLILFGFALGKTGLMDPDEPFYSLTAKEMLDRSDASTPVMFGQPQFEKPILFYWVLYYSFKYLGVHEGAARLGPSVAGLLTVCLTYFWGKALFKRRSIAFMAAVMLASSGQFIVLSRIVLTDMFLCLFVTGALCSFTLGYRNKPYRALYWNSLFVFCALGFLTKGPLGILIPFFGIVSYLIAVRETELLSEIPWVSGLSIFSLVALPWYALMTQKYGIGFLDQFFLHENIRRFFIAEHKGMDKGYYYVFVILLGFFPWSGLLAASIPFAFRRSRRRHGYVRKEFLFLVLAAFVPFVFFTLAKSKLMSYIFPIYPVLALLTAAFGYRLFRVFRMGARSRLSLTMLIAVTFVLFPVALSWGAYAYSLSQHLALESTILAIGTVFVSFSWASFYFFSKRQLRASLISAVTAVICLSSLAFGWMMPQAQKMFSSKGWAKEYDTLLSSKPDMLFLASKMFVRGMTFYTGSNRVGVFSNHANGDFYTPHPIRIVFDPREFHDMAPGQFPVYLLIRNKEWKHLKQNLDTRYKLSIMEGTPQKMLVRLDRV